MSNTRRPQPGATAPDDNLTGLTELNETTLLSAVQERYARDLVYTDVGDILVAVNPFRTLPVYDRSWSDAYNSADASSLAPHIFRVGARAFNAMILGKKDQVCVISGESGAGKTESAKFIMRQVMEMSRSTGLGQKLQQKITQLNPLLEAFGNAQTALNDNSSRFGKYIQLTFDPNGRIVGAGIEQYLLEKSRVCVQGNQERNFHIFYYLYAGLAPEMLKQLSLKNPTQHHYLKSYRKVQQDCSSAESKEKFQQVFESMKSIGFAQEEINDIITVLAGIILIGDIEFVGADEGEDNAEVKNPKAAETVAQLLQLDSCEELCFALTTLRTETRGEVVDKRYTCTKAADVKDAIAKALYARMFQWIVARLNSHLQPSSTHDQLNIGILDIFGFEDFDVNSFEQFCINLANEQLQQYFNHQIFAMEKIEYAKEGLEGLEISFKDNKPVLDLFLMKPIGLLSLLDEQCRGLNGTEVGFVQRCRESFAQHQSYVPHRGNALTFSIKHYAGEVDYEIEGFLEKNKDSLPDAVVAAVKFSSLRLIRTLFMRPPGAASQLRKSIMKKSQRSVMRAMSRRRKSMDKKKRQAGRRKLYTVSAHFRQSLDLLMERVFAASPHFVRCIKPNLDKQPNSFTGDFVLRQLRYTGMLEAVRVRREGFAYRPFFSDFFHSYRCLAFKCTDQKVKASVAACQTILGKAGITGWRIGRSRVFLRYFHEEKLQLLLKDREDKCIVIQKIFRGYRTRKWVKPLQATQQKEKALLAGFMLSLNQHGQECFPTLLSLNKTDIQLAAKRFRNVQKDAKAQEERDLAGLSDKEKRKKKAQKAGILVPVFGTALVEQKSQATEPPKRRHSSGYSDEETSLSPTHSHTSSRRSSLQSNCSLVSSPIHEEENLLLTAGSLSNGWSASPKRAASPSLSPSRQPFGGIKLLPNLHVSPNRRAMARPDSPLSPKSNSPPVPLPRFPRIPRSPRKSPVAKAALVSPSSPEHRVFTVNTNSPSPPNDNSATVYRTSSASSNPASASSSQHQQRKSTEQGSLRHGLKARKSQNEISLDFSTSGYTRRMTGDKKESDYDYMANGSQAGMLNKAISSSVPNLLLDELPKDTMVRNLLNLRVLANSTSELLEEDDYEPHANSRRISQTSTSSGPFSDLSPRTSFSERPPQADKRSSAKPKVVKARDKARSRIGSHSSGSDVPLSPAINEYESDLNVLGYYPTLSADNLTDLVLGQPRGTYAIYKEDNRMFPEFSRWEPAYGLVVSLGRSVEVFPVSCSYQTDTAGFQCHVENTTNGAYFSHMKAMIKYYQKTDLTADLRLTQPRLLAGVAVSGLRPAPAKPTLATRLGILTESPRHHHRQLSPTHSASSVSSSSSSNTVPKTKTLKLGRRAFRRKKVVAATTLPVKT